MNKKDKIKMVVGALVLIAMTSLIWKYAYTNVMGIEKVSNQVLANDLITQSSDEKNSLNEYELALYNGKNGQPAYIAVSGIIYDVTSLWSNGSHQGYQAGMDLTTAFAASPHSMVILNDLPVVGILGQSVQVSNPTYTTEPSQTSESNQSPQVQIPNAAANEWTVERLAQYDGKNGQPAYIAVNGIIYDVTSPWSNGSHEGYQAGADLTAVFSASPHSMATLNSLPLVGMLGQSVQAPETTQVPESNYVPEPTQPPQVQNPPVDTNEWTVEKLAQYDGKNGQSAYIAVSGIIYDVTSSWSNGSHQGYQAGADLTSAFAASPHSMSTINGLPVVGMLGQSIQAPESTHVPEPTQPPQVQPSPADANEWTVEKLAQYDGKNGQPAYIAVSGIIYDVTSVWNNGSHQGYQAGTDLTAAFAASPHSMSTLNGLPVVGQYNSSNTTNPNPINNEEESDDDEHDEDSEEEEDDEESEEEDD